MTLLIGFTILLLANLALIAVLFIIPLWRKRQAIETPDTQADIAWIRQFVADNPAPKVSKKHSYFMLRNPYIAYINTDELAQLDFERHADTQAIPRFVADSLERKAAHEAMNATEDALSELWADDSAYADYQDLPDYVKRWIESEDES